MPHESEKGSFATEIPEDVLADAVAAVERRAPKGATSSEVEVEVEAEGSDAPGGGVPGDPSRDELAAQVATLTARLNEERGRLLRVAADADNYKKRAAKEREEVLHHGVERLVKELLPALDSLERALATESSTDPEALRTGVELTRRLFEEALARFEVKGFSAKGESFDPRVHEALMTLATSAAAPGMVVEEQHRGFFLRDRLIRPAAVVVSAPPREEEPKAEGAPDAASQGEQG